MWHGDERCNALIQRHWSQPTTGNVLHQIGQKIANTGQQLMAWHVTEFQQQKNELHSLEAKMNDIMKRPFSHEQYEEQRLLHVRHSQILAQQEKYWRQRSRAVWLKEGDRNSAFFHSKASNRRSRNTIKGLKNEGGEWTTDPDEISRILVDYYKNIFATEGCDDAALSEIFRATPMRVIPLMNLALLQPYTDEEIKTALFQMHPSKSPAPDECLSALLSQAVESGFIIGLKMCHQAPILHHLFFADDSFLFGEATVQECLHVRAILDIYAKASGQRCVEEHDRYLGLPLTVGKSKTAKFLYIKEKLTKRLVNWKAKLLSSVGKEILIKAVVQTMPLYVMNCYLLPKGLCDDIHQLCASFFWGDTDAKKRIHWRSWEKLCLTKQEGGMGFKNIYAYNLAMLAKQGWRFLSNPDSLVARLFKARYFPNCTFWEAQLGDAPSFSWRSILEGRPILKAGVKWRIGDGSNVHIWNDQWIPHCSSFLLQQSRPSSSHNMVSDLINPHDRTWIHATINTLFPAVIAE
ncbi:uncharacterized protein LOC112194201 [Rosa chinensis]|uniref:uncharacterized protein LOC112194201 n=1 Tax=Rosa chinensis TaxID=74649 RepID=UPI000D0865C7|nr:uncharacterized protein LOC112194201 [Rosa chinensis]